MKQHSLGCSDNRHCPHEVPSTPVDRPVDRTIVDAQGIIVNDGPTLRERLGLSHDG